MLYKEFADSLGIDIDIDNASKGTREFPTIGNIGKKIDISLDFAIRGIIGDKENRQRILDTLSLEYFPPDIHYYLMDKVLVNKENKEVHWYSQMNGNNIDIAIFKVKTKDILLCDKDITFVEGVEFVSGLSDDIMDSIIMILKEHVKSGKSLFERWCQADDNWRSNHLICPVCGSPISTHWINDEFVGAECGYCEWISTKNYYSKRDFSYIPNMKAELKKYKKKVHKIEIQEKLYHEMKVSIDSFILSAINESPKEDAFDNYCTSIQQAINDLSVAQVKLREKKKEKLRK